MSKKGSMPLIGNSPMGGRVMYDYEITNLEGKLLTFIESLGLREGQEKSAKDIFKDIFYRSMYYESLYISGDILQPAVDKHYETNGSRIAMGNPRSGHSIKR